MVILFIFIVWAVFVPKTIAYDFGKGRGCTVSPRILPGLFETPTDESKTFKLHHSKTLAIGRFVIYSHSLCASHQNPPKGDTVEHYAEQFRFIPFIGQDTRIVTASPPKLTTRIIKHLLASPDLPLKLSLSEKDVTFGYMVTHKDLSAPCTVHEQSLQCSLTPLKLEYATDYTLSVMRSYEGKALDQVESIPLKTITPTNVVHTSVPSGGNVEQKPTEITFATDKALKSVGDVRLVAKSGSTETLIPTKTSFTDKIVTVKIMQELTRKTAFELRVASVQATDTSGFDGESYTLPFTTSGGPKVVRPNIGNKNVALNQAITLTFDQTLLSTQNIGPLMTFTVNGAPAAATYSMSNNTITVKPAAALPLCASFAIKVGSSVQSLYGVSGDAAWSFTSRAICYTTFSIGASVKGRGLTAYKFGTGAEHILYVGAIHGSEANSKRLMEEWFRELQAYPERLPAHRSLVVIPSANPDGIALNSRYNSRGIDLNRNFPSNDWKSVVTSPTNAQPHPAGGPAPLSEPESAALASYIRQIAPRLVMSFHSKASVVEANEAGDSGAIAAEYARKARYQAMPKSKSISIFKYDTTGAMEDWMRDKLGRAAIVVELSNNTSSEFGRNRDALWYSARF